MAQNAEMQAQTAIQPTLLNALIILSTDTAVMP